jgi:hypothetical protein
MMIGLVTVNAENDHSRRPRKLLRTSRHLDPAQLGHADIEDDQVRQMFFAQRQCLQTIAGLRDDRLAGGFQQPSKPTADDAVVVSQQHAHARSP